MVSEKNWEQSEKTDKTDRQTDRQTDSQTNVKLKVRRFKKGPGFYMHTDIFPDMP